MKLKDIKVGETYVNYTATSWASYKILSKQGDLVRFEYFKVIYQPNEPLWVFNKKRRTSKAGKAHMDFDDMTDTKKHFVFQLIFRK